MPEMSFQWVPVEYESVPENLLKPQALVEIKAATGDWKIFYPEIDTGTSLSIFTEADCDFLGLNLTDGTAFRLGSLLGSIIAYMHEVEMRIGTEIIRSRVAFTEGNYKQLLGRVDVLDNFRICFSGKHKQTVFTRELQPAP